MDKNHCILKLFCQSHPEYSADLKSADEILHKKILLKSELDKVYMAMYLIANDNLKHLVDAKNTTTVPTSTANVSTVVSPVVVKSNPSKTIKDYFKDRLEDMKQKKHDLKKKIEVMTGYDISDTDLQISALEKTLKHGTYEQASRILLMLMEYKVMDQAIYDYTYSNNLM